MTTDNFDLEEDILKCWSLTDDLGETLDDMENNRIDMEKAIAVLRAFQAVYEHKFDRCFRTFKAVSQQNRDLMARLRDLEYSSNMQQILAKSGDSKQQKKVD